jgi:hypothetical protein
VSARAAAEAGGAAGGAGGGECDGAAGQCAGQGAAYALGLWPKLVRFVEYGEVGAERQFGGESDARSGVGSQKLDAHRQCGGGAQGRGDPVGGGGTCPDVGTSNRLGLDLRAYLADVLPGLPMTSMQRVGELPLVGWRPPVPERRRLAYGKTPSPVQNAVGPTLPAHPARQFSQRARAGTGHPGVSDRA